MRQNCLSRNTSAIASTRRQSSAKYSALKRLNFTAHSEIISALPCPMCLVQLRLADCACTSRWLRGLGRRSPRPSMKNIQPLPRRSASGVDDLPEQVDLEPLTLSADLISQGCRHAIEFLIEK